MTTTTKHITQYKNSPLGLIPEDWEVKKISDFGKVYTGNTPPTNDQENYGNEYMFVSPSDLGTTKYILNTEKRLSEKGFLISRKFESGSVLFTCIGSTIGKSGIAIEDLTSNQQINAITVNQFNNNEFLFYQLQKNYKQIKLLAGEQAVPILNKSQFEQIKLLAAPLREQKAIADCLSTWDRAIEKQTALIAQKEFSKKALMQQLLSGKKRLKGFGGDWKEVRLGKVCDLVNGMAFKPNEWTTSGMPIIRIQNLNGSNDFNFFDGNVQSRYLVNNGDLLFAWSGSRGTSFGAFRWFREQAVLNQHIFNVFPKNGFERDFAFQLLKWLTIQIERKAHGSAGLVHVTKKQLESEIMKIPNNKGEQTAIANVLQFADDELQLLKKKLDQLKEQKKGLMQVLLTGKKRLKC